MSITNPIPHSQAEIKKILKYYPDTGKFFWNILANYNKAHKGAQAGYLSKAGYIQIGLKGSNFFAHRIAWFYFYGEDPVGWIDHINHDKSDNRIKNLRIVTPTESNKNLSIRKDNTSGNIGVHFDKRKNNWHAYINEKGRRTNLGRFFLKNDAIKARKLAEIKFRFHENHGCAKVVA